MWLLKSTFPRTLLPTFLTTPTSTFFSSLLPKTPPFRTSLSSSFSSSFSSSSSSSSLFSSVSLFSFTNQNQPQHPPPPSTPSLTFLRHFAKELIPPRRRNFRKASRGRIPVPTGGSLVGTHLMYGRYGLKLRQGTRLTAAQLESARRVLRRKLKDYKDAQCWLRVFPDIPVTKKGTEVRMGKGKGSVDHYVCRVGIDRVVFEIDAVGLKWEVAKEALVQAGHRLPVPVKLVAMEHGEVVGKLLPALCHSKPVTGDVGEGEQVGSEGSRGG